MRRNWLARRDLWMTQTNDVELGCIDFEREREGNLVFKGRRYKKPPHLDCTVILALCVCVCVQYLNVPPFTLGGKPASPVICLDQELTQSITVVRRRLLSSRPAREISKLTASVCVNVDPSLPHHQQT